MDGAREIGLSTRPFLYVQDGVGVLKGRVRSRLPESNIPLVIAFSMTTHYIKEAAREFTFLQDALQKGIDALEAGKTEDFNRILINEIMSRVEQLKIINNKAKALSVGSEQILNDQNKIENVYIITMVNARHNCGLYMIELDYYPGLRQIEKKVAMGNYEGVLSELSDFILNSREDVAKMRQYLDMAKNGTGVELVNINQIVAQVAERYRQRIERKELALKVQIASEAANCACDRNLLTLVLNNLIENAIKYTHQGEIIVKLYPGEVDRRNLSGEVERFGNRVIIEIIDSGIGIPYKEHFKIFSFGYRAGNVGLIPGTGQGLAFVATVVENLFGGIAIKSEISRGTTFRIDLPRA